MMEVFSRAVDEVVGHDITQMPDAAIRAEFIGLSREGDRLACRRSLLLAALHGRGIPAGDGASSTPPWVQSQTGQRYSEAKASLDAGLACVAMPLTAKAWEQGEISTSAVVTTSTATPARPTRLWASA